MTRDVRSFLSSTGISVNTIFFYFFYYEVIKREVKRIHITVGVTSERLKVEVERFQNVTGEL